MARVLLSMLVLLGCSSRSEQTSAPPPSSDPPSVPEEVAPPLPSPGETAEGAGDVRAAIDVYRAAITAFNRQDRDRYFASFADRLECFYGREDVPLATVRSQRLREGDRGLLAAAQLEVIAHRADEVVLLDRGLFSESPGSARQVLHEKIVVLARRDGSFRIIAETGAANRSCVSERVPDALPVSTEFGSCRDAHATCLASCACATEDRACRGCRLECERAAATCLGVASPTDRAIETSTTVLTSEAEVRRFVELSLTYATGGGPDLERSDSRWLSSVSRGLGAPRWRLEADGTDGYCVGQIFRPMSLELYEDLRVEHVQCTAARDRCVAWIRGREYEAGEATLRLHLLFDGAALRVARLEEPTAVRPPDPSEPERYAQRRPPEWEARCQPAIEALAEDRAAEDFFSIAMGEPDPRQFPDIPEDDLYEYAATVTRHCGEAARAAVRAVGDEWDCEETSCSPFEMCGNYCEHVSFDEHGAVLAHSAGIDAVTVEAAAAARLRARVPCGRSVPVTFDDLADE